MKFQKTLTLKQPFIKSDTTLQSCQCTMRGTVTRLRDSGINPLHPVGFLSPLVLGHY